MKYYRRNKSGENKMKYTIIIICLAVIFAGCSSGMKYPGCDLKPGMTKEEANRLYPCESEMSVMVRQGRSADGCRITLENGTRFTLTFDKDGRLLKILTTDGSFRLAGDIGVGSTFEEVKQAFSDYRILISPGYGRLVVIDDDTSLGFLWKKPSKYSPIIDDTEKVTWVEMNRIPIPKGK